MTFLLVIIHLASRSRLYGLDWTALGVGLTFSEWCCGGDTERTCKSEELTAGYDILTFLCIRNAAAGLLRAGKYTISSSRHDLAVLWLKWMTIQDRDVTLPTGFFWNSSPARILLNTSYD
jgi:hypothetical protein